jgi:outer membrane receptor protein involved in Fe transport
MSKRHRIDRAVRYALMTGAAAAAIGYAATASAANGGAPAKLGKVTVTGTRIRRSSIETAQPITRISRQQIQKSGYTNLNQLLGNLSFSGGHASNTGNFSGGATTVSLRGLGANRNLVLVNGKRWLQGLNGTVNLNTIPTSIIDHIEILQDGASAIYGSDAIAGVVNVITRKNFNGAEGHAYYGIRNADGHWDGQIKQYDFTVGGGNKRGNVVFNTTYREENAVPAADRPLAATPIAGLPGYVGGNAASTRGHFRLYGPRVGGKTFGQATCAPYNPATPNANLCNLTLANVPAAPSLQNFRPYRPTDAYNIKKDIDLRAPLKDVSLYVQGHYDLFDNLTFVANAEYIRNEAYRPEPPDPVPIGAANSSTANGQKIGISASNPYNPFGVDLVADRNDPCIAAGTCIGVNTINRMLIENGLTRSNSNTADDFHIYAGFKGFVNLFSREIDWNVGFAQNRQQMLHTGHNLNNDAKIAQALGTNCTAPCVPLNLFGGATRAGNEPGMGSITPAQLNYIGYEPHDIGQANLRDWTANLTTDDAYDLPGGPLGIAIGWERIDNYGYHHPDSVKVAGNGNDAANGPALNGRLVRNAEYAELNIPILSDLPAAKSLSIDVANRWTQFKQSGGINGEVPTTSFLHNSSGRLNIRYQPMTSLLLRASWSQGFRSPNVTGLFGGQSRSRASVNDPCAPGPNGGYHGGPLPPNCPGGTQDAQPNYLIPNTVGSNPNLKPEKSISRTLGFVYSPSQVPGLDVNAGYFKIEINNNIGSVGAQNILNGCFNYGSFCNLVTTSGGQITDIRNIATNVGSLLTEGVDLGIHYKFPATSFGDFDLRINSTFLTKFDQSKVNNSTSTGFATAHLLGTVTHPKRRASGTLSWNYGNWSARYHIQYISDGITNCGVGPGLAPGGYCTYPNRTTNFEGVPNTFGLGKQHLGAVTYHDVFVSYTVPSINTTFSLGVNNLFAKKPPINSHPGLTSSFNEGFYRGFSRLIYGNIRVQF